LHAPPSFCSCRLAIRPYAQAVARKCVCDEEEERGVGKKGRDELGCRGMNEEKGTSVNLAKKPHGINMTNMNKLSFNFKIRL
jgi:hypothetical protein